MVTNDHAIVVVESCELQNSIATKRPILLQSLWLLNLSRVKVLTLKTFLTVKRVSERPDHRDANCRLVDAPCCWPGGSFECAVRNCWEQWTREGTHVRKTGSGATRKTTRREDRRIVRQALVDPTVMRSTIPADVVVAIVPQTISRHLAEANLKSKHPLRSLPLTPEHRQLRLQWCQAR
ncbi:transposable element Tc1 transposase [Trichonephila clavipes]|nr:transposable element Tc1 transposase [Trichonephila clavipes]